MGGSLSMFQSIINTENYSHNKYDYECKRKVGNHIEVMKYKEPFILTTLSLPAATVLHIGSYAERKRARKVNPLLDQSEHYLKKDCSRTHSRGVWSMCPWAIKQPKRWFGGFLTFDQKTKKQKTLLNERCPRAICDWPIQQAGRGWKANKTKMHT